MTLAALDRAWREAADPYEREHVTPYIHRHPELFSLAHLSQDVDRSAWRWTVDTPEDWAMVEAVYQALYRPGEPFHRRRRRRLPRGASRDRAAERSPRLSQALRFAAALTTPGDDTGWGIDAAALL